MELTTIFIVKSREYNLDIENIHEPLKYYIIESESVVIDENRLIIH